MEVGPDWYLERSVERDITSLCFDVTGEHGQSRRLDLVAVAEKLTSFEHAPPREPYAVTLWPSDVTGMLSFLTHVPTILPFSHPLRHQTVHPFRPAWCESSAGPAREVDRFWSGRDAAMVEGGDRRHPEAPDPDANTADDCR